MTWRARAAAVAIGTLALIGGVACGGSYSTESSGPPLTSTVLVVDDAFQPVVDTVKVSGTITWAWLNTSANVSTDHNIISTGTASFPSVGNNVTLGTGTSGTDFFSNPHSYQWVFPTAGSYNFFCSVHGTATTGMKARIDVLP